jgi:hypothetical protein
MSNSGLAENPTRTLADLDNLLDKSIDAMDKRQLSNFRRDAKKVVSRAENRAKKTDGARGKQESTRSIHSS